MPPASTHADGIASAPPRAEADVCGSAQFLMRRQCAEMENADQDWAWPALPRSKCDDPHETPAADSYCAHDRSQDRGHDTPQVGGRSSFGWAVSPERRP